MTTISVVIPVFNEEKNVPILYSRLKNVLNDISISHEVIFIDDGSTDKSLQKIKDLRKKDKKVKIISFSRNFGHMAAVSAGLKHSKGKKVVIMDADLQDPPRIIKKMYEKSLKGFDIVYGVKKKRKEGVIKKLLFKSFYKILNRIAQLKMPLDTGTFSLINRHVVDILNSLPERNKYISGLRVWTGFEQAGIVYARAKRRSGKESSLGKLFKLALDGLISFSYLPLRVASILGLMLGVVSLFLIIVVLVGRFYFGKGVIGWASTMVTILFIGSVQLITLGIIGEYLARIYDEVKNRPEYIISLEEGFGKK